ncbi:MAG: hypothetical protein QOF48_4009 [Verrucomicrobiota bacterium]|jgi:hypothetical protein
MKTNLMLSLSAAALLVLPGITNAADKKAEPAKPYPFDKCLVSGDKLGADPDMKPHVFTVDGQEVKLCCKSCLKDFNKDKAKHMATIQEAQKKSK